MLQASVIRQTFKTVRSKRIRLVVSLAGRILERSVAQLAKVTHVLNLSIHALPNSTHIPARGVTDRLLSRDYCLDH